MSITLPHNLEAEQAILGALLYNNLSYEKVAFLKPSHFFHPTHRQIFQTIVEMISKTMLVTPITIAPIFKDNEEIQTAGGPKYWVNLVSNIGPIANITSNGQHVYDLFLRREIIAMAHAAIENADKFEVQKNASDQIEAIEVALFKMASLKNSENNVKTFKAALQEVVAMAKDASQKNSLVGITTGLTELNNHLGGFHKSDLIILAARPSMGKTALATTFAFNAAKAFVKNPNEGAKVLFFSLEMSSEQLAQRLLGQEANISSDRIRRGAISQKEFQILDATSQTLYSVPLFIDDTPALTIAGLTTRARRLYRQEKINFIIVDYLQLLNIGKYTENRVEELSAITRGLKALAKELNVPVLALSQLSRAAETSDDTMPQLHHLRGSGSIEQDADCVMFIFREAYALARKKPASGSAEMQEWQLKMSRVFNAADIIIAKQRHGPIGNIRLFFDENTTKFSNYTHLN